MSRSGSDSFNLVLVAVGGVLALGVTLYVAAREGARYPEPLEWWVEDGDADRGPAAIRAYGCGSCHVIPGIRNAEGKVGPALTGLREKQYIAGQIANDPEALVHWIMDPRHLAPGTAMPDLGVTEAKARDIAAFLYTIE